MIRIMTLAIALSVVATSARAQGFSFVPSFGISQLYDSNVFYRPLGESDTTTRASSRVDVGLRSERHTFWSSYGLDADRFDRHPELTTAHARQDAALDEQYHATRRLSVAGAAAFTETQAPADLNIQSALTSGRTRAQRTTVHPSLTYQAGRLTTATFGYTATDDRMLNVRLLTQTATAALERHPSARDVVRFEFTHQNYLFNASQRQTSHAMTTEWTRELTRAITIVVRGGPRLGDRTLSADVGASVRHRTRTGETSLAYDHAQTTLVGLVGVADTHSLMVRVSGEPRPGLRVRFEPGVLRTMQMDRASTVYRMAAAYSQEIAPRLMFEASYDLNLQHGNIYTLQSVDTIGRNVTMVRLVVTSATTVRQ
jgi:hypothetical protein